MAETVETAIYRLQIEGQAQIDALKTSIDGLAVSEDKLTATNRVTTDQIEKRIASYDPLLRAQQAYRKELEYIENVQASGVGTQQQINALFEGATSKYQAQTAAINGLGDAHAGLSNQAQAALHSIRGFVEQVAMGVPITRALTSEASRLSYVATGEGGISGAFKEAGSFITSMISPTTAAIAAVTALGAAALYAANNFDKLQVSSQRAISGAGARTGTTVEDINKFVQQNSPSGSASAGGISDTEARQLAEGFTRTGDIVVSQLNNMSSAVVGFANQTGKSVSDSIKAFVDFGKDPVKAMDTLAETFGPLDQDTQNLVRYFVEAGDKTQALNVVTNGYSEQLKKAASDMGVLEAAGRAFWNLMGQEGSKPLGIATQIANVKQQLDAVIAEAPKLVDPTEIGAASDQITYLTNKLAALQAQQEKNNALTAQGTANKLAADATAAANAIVPEVAQIEKLNAEIAVMQAAQAAGVGNADQLAAAIARARAEVEKLTVAMSANTITLSDNAAKSGAIVSALGNAATAQEKLTAAVDAFKLKAAEAHLNSEQYNRGLANIYDEAQKAEDAQQSFGGAVSSASSDMQNGASSAASLANNLGDVAQQAETAAEAASNLGSTLAGIYAQGKDPFASLLGDTSGGGTGGDVVGSIPTVLTYRGYQAGYSPYVPPNAGNTLNNTPTSAPSAQDMVDQYLQQGGVDYALSQLMNPSAVQQAISGGTPDYSSISSLYQLKNQQTSDTGVQAANLQQEMAWLKGQTETLARDQSITQLQSSIDSLTKSTDSLNSTNQDLLSPYYTQDPRTSHIGFRSQGMASGGYVDVPGGVSANDNMLATIPVASGERIYVDPMTGRRSSTGSGNAIVLNISSPVIVQAGANTDAIGRTLYQSNQALARQIRAAMPS